MIHDGTRLEAHKKPGVHYALTADRLELPIVDVTHPAFALATTKAEQSAEVDAFLRQQQPLWLGTTFARAYK